jgi:hypothetical protein
MSRSVQRRPVPPDANLKQGEIKLIRNHIWHVCCESYDTYNTSWRSCVTLLSVLKGLHDTVELLFRAGRLDRGCGAVASHPKQCNGVHKACEETSMTALGPADFSGALLCIGNGKSERCGRRRSPFDLNARSSRHVESVSRESAMPVSVCARRELAESRPESHRPYDTAHVSKCPHMIEDVLLAALECP